jgi:hypothetical protein
MTNTDTLKIEVSIRITEKQGYDVREIAAAKVEDNAPWDEIKPTAVHFAVDAAIEDVTARVQKQLKAEHAKRRAVEIEAQRNAEESVF